MNNTITAVNGILVGHQENKDAFTGCTAVLCEKGAIGGISQRGGAPGTRDTDLLRPMHMVEKVHGIFLSGGSAFGLDAASGVMRYFEERNIGFKTEAGVVPIVPAAIIYDLSIGDATIRPDADMAYRACQAATTNPVVQGNFGAGCGATVGKILGGNQAMKSGTGSFCRDLGGGIMLGSLAIVNAFGDVIDYQNRSIMAGARSINKGPVKLGEEDFFANTLEMMLSFAGKKIMGFASKQNTIIGIIATNAILNKEETNLLASSASEGISLSIQPSFTMFDGDTVFSLATCRRKADINILRAFAPQVFAEAIRNAVLHAESAAGLPSAKDKMK